LGGILSRKHYFPKPLVAATVVVVVVVIVVVVVGGGAVVVVAVVIHVNRKFAKFPSAVNERAQFFTCLC